MPLAGIGGLSRDGRHVIAVSSTTTTAGPPTGTGLHGRPGNLAGPSPARRARHQDRCCSSAALLSVATTVGIVVALLRPAIDFFARRAGLASSSAGPAGHRTAPTEYGVWPLVSATFLMTLHRTAGGRAARPRRGDVPLGVRLADGRATRLKPVVELLAGVPSVVYGFFALTFVTPTLLQELLHLDVGFTNALAAGLVLGVMIIPTVASLSEDAMSAVPLALRQGSLAMGANRMQTTLRVVFPAAISGIAAAVVLGTVPCGRRDHDRRARGGIRPEPLRSTRARACRR